MSNQLVAEAVTHTKHKRRTFMPSAGLEPEIPTFFVSCFPVLLLYFPYVVLLSFSLLVSLSVPYNAYNKNIHAPRQNSNPQSQKASAHRPTPQTARPPKSALLEPSNLISRKKQLQMLTLRIGTSLVNAHAETRSQTELLLMVKP